MKFDPEYLKFCMCPENLQADMLIANAPNLELKRALVNMLHEFKKNIKDYDPEFRRVVDENFWDLI